MGFAQEMKEFIAGFDAGSRIQDRWDDRKLANRKQQYYEDYTGSQAAEAKRQFDETNPRGTAAERTTAGNIEAGGKAPGNVRQMATEAVSYITNHPKYKGISADMAFAMLGNAGHESGLNPTIRNDRGEQSYGWFQLNSKGGEGIPFQQWLQGEGKGRNPGDWKTQVDFVLDRMNGPYRNVWDQMRKAPDLATKTTLFQNGYERPKDRTGSLASRIGWANNVATWFGGSQQPPTTGGATAATPASTDTAAAPAKPTVTAPAAVEPALAPTASGTRMAGLDPTLTETTPNDERLLINPNPDWSLDESTRISLARRGGAIPRYQGGGGVGYVQQDPAALGLAQGVMAGPTQAEPAKVAAQGPTAEQQAAAAQAQQAAQQEQAYQQLLQARQTEGVGTLRRGGAIPHYAKGGSHDQEEWDRRHREAAKYDPSSGISRERGDFGAGAPAYFRNPEPEKKRAIPKKTSKADIPKGREAKGEPEPYRRRGPPEREVPLYPTYEEHGTPAGDLGPNYTQSGITVAPPRIQTPLQPALPPPPAAPNAPPTRYQPRDDSGILQRPDSELINPVLPNIGAGSGGFAPQSTGPSSVPNKAAPAAPSTNPPPAAPPPARPGVQTPGIPNQTPNVIRLGPSAVAGLMEGRPVGYDEYGNPVYQDRPTMTAARGGAIPRYAGGGAVDSKKQEMDEYLNSRQEEQELLGFENPMTFTPVTLREGGAIPHFADGGGFQGGGYDPTAVTHRPGRGGEESFDTGSYFREEQPNPEVVQRARKRLVERGKQYERMRPKAPPKDHPTPPGAPPETPYPEEPRGRPQPEPLPQGPLPEPPRVALPKPEETTVGPGATQTPPRFEPQTPEGIPQREGSESAAVPLPLPRSAAGVPGSPLPSPSQTAVQTGDPNAMTPALPPGTTAPPPAAAPPAVAQAVPRPGQPTPAPAPATTGSVQPKPPKQVDPEVAKLTAVTPAPEVAHAVMTGVNTKLGENQGKNPMQVLEREAASREEVAMVEQKSDPAGKLPVEDRRLKALQDVYDYYNSIGRPKMAEATLARMGMHYQQQSMMAGAIALTALRKGNVDHALQALQAAHAYTPDGMTVDYQKTADGKYLYRLIDSSSGAMTEWSQATPELIQGMAQKAASGMAFFELMSGSAGKRGAGGQANIKEPKEAKDKSDKTIENEEDDAYWANRQQQFAADAQRATDPKQRAILEARRDAVPFDRWAARSAASSKTAPNMEGADTYLNDVKDDNVRSLFRQQATDLRKFNPTMSTEQAVSMVKKLASSPTAMKENVQKSKDGRQYEMRGYGPFYMTWDLMTRIGNLSHDLKAGTPK